MRRIIEKYTQPRAYLPAFDHGSCFIAAANPGGLLLVTGMLIRLTRVLVGIERRLSRPVCKEGMVAGWMPKIASVLVPALQSLSRNHRVFFTPSELQPVLISSSSQCRQNDVGLNQPRDSASPQAIPTLKPALFLSPSAELDLVSCFESYFESYFESCSYRQTEEHRAMPIVGLCTD